MKKNANAAMNISTIEELQRKLHNAEKAEQLATSERELLAAMTDCIHLESQISAFYESTKKSPLEIIAISITIHSLKMLARGRSYTKKDGTHVFTPINIQAQKILEAGRNDASGILEDLTSAVTLEIWKAISDGTITISEKISTDGAIFPKLELVDDADTSAMRKILNVVQFEFYQNQQKHFKHEYRPTIDDEGNEDFIMVTAALREYEKSIEFIGENELLESLQIELTSRERAVLMAKLETKQVERTYSDNGISKRHYVSRYAAIPEIAEAIGITEKQVRVSLSNIKIKCKTFRK